MNTKLTLRLDENLIRQAKLYAHKEGKSISQIVGDYFKMIKGKSPSRKKFELKPRSTQLYGSLKRSKVSEKDYKTYLESKYL